MLSDFRLAFRTLAKTPGFAVVAILILSLGIGLSTSSFSIANAMLFRTLPYPESGNLVRVYRTSPQSQTWPHSPANYLDLRDACISFANFCCYTQEQWSYAEKGKPAEQIFGMGVAPDFLSSLHLQPILGRDFTKDEDQAGKNNVAILSHRMWTRRFANDPQVIGRTVRLDGESLTVIGVLPANFEAPLVWGPVELLRPFTIWPGFRTNRADSWLNIMARPKPGIALKQAQSELSTVIARLNQQYPKENGTDGLTMVPLHSSNMFGPNRTLNWFITGLSVLVLMIACANLASLQLARSLRFHRDLAIRSALGASRLRLMRPLLFEALILSTAGGIAGILQAAWISDLIGRSLLINNEPGFYIPIDLNVLFFAMLASVGTGVVFGVAPAWFGSRIQASESLKEGARGSTGGKSHQRIKFALITCELALALIVVSAASAFSIASKRFTSREMGWKPDGLFSGSVLLPYNRYGQDPQRLTFQKELLTKLEALPGVEKASLSTGLPLYSYFSSNRIVAEGQATITQGQEPLTQQVAISADFFSALRIPLKQGEQFSPNLKADSPPLIIINESVAKRFWPGEIPIGKRLRFADKDAWMQVVAVVGDVHMAGNLSEPETRLQVYRPLIQAPGNYLNIAIKTSLSPDALTAQVRQAVTALDPDLPVQQAGSLRHSIEINMANLDVVVAILVGFSLMGLLIAAIGIYGVISHLTAQRTRDIGIRIALGAQFKDVIAMILRQGMMMLAGGVAIGLIGTFVLNFALQRAMPEMIMPGAWLQVLTVALLSAITLVACYLPAQRAARVDPVIALRAD